MHESARAATSAFALIAAFALLTAPAALPSAIADKQPKKNSIKSKHIKDGQVQPQDLADFAVTMAKLAQDAVGSANVVDNALTGADIDESQLDPDVLQRRVTAACALGQFIRSIDASGNVVCADDADADTNTTYTAGSGLALEGTQFKLRQDCAAGQVLKLVGGDWACANDLDTTTATDVACSSACISDAEVADAITVGAGGSVVDAALSANVALLSGAQTFSGLKAFTAATTFSYSSAEQALFEQTAGDSGSSAAIRVHTTNDNTAGADSAVRLTNQQVGTEALDALLHLENLDGDAGDALLRGVDITGTGTDTVITALDASDASISRALAIGSNLIVTDGATIQSTELDRLDGKDAPLVDENDGLPSLRLDAQAALGTCDASTAGSIAYKNPVGADNDAMAACLESGAGFAWVKLAGTGTVP